MDSLIQKNAPTITHLLPNQSNNPDLSGTRPESKDSALFTPRDQLREYERKEILRAVTEGRLGLRVIEPEQERSYLSQKHKEPRPVCFIQDGIPIETRNSDINMLGILNPEVLAVYKANAVTRQLIDPRKALDELEIKCLGDIHQIQKKVREETEQKWDVYPDFTSGHLQPDGTFTLPKLKGHDKYGAKALIPYPELLTTGYDATQIKCYCIRKKDALRNVTDILKEKHSLENALGLDPLPLMVYCQYSGSVEVYFDEELEGNQLKQNEPHLDNLAKFYNIVPLVFRGILNMLPMPVKVESLNKTKLDAKPSINSSLHDLIEMTTNPACYNPERLQLIKDGGVSLNRHLFFKGKYTTLIDLFIEYQRKQFHAEHFNWNRTIKSAGNDSDSKRKAYLLFHDLIQSGITNIETNRLDLNTTPPYLCNFLAAIIEPELTTHFCKFMIHPLDFPAIKVELDRFCRKHHKNTNKFLKYALRRPFLYEKEFTFYKHYLLALFYYGAIPNKRMFDAIRQEITTFSGKAIGKALGNCSTDRYLDWVQNLYQRRKKNRFYQSWPAQVEEAKQAIAQLRTSLNLQTDPTLSPEIAYDQSELQFVVDAFSKPPALANAQDNEETILKILQHYYRRPGPERVLRNLHHESLPAVWKPKHSCSHVLRARNNALWYMELLEKFRLVNCTEDEKTLLALAAIYHDAAAEDVGKDREEKQSAQYFKRDLTGQYPQALLDDVALALESKENAWNDDSLPATTRRYLRILRFADRMDIIRCTGVEENFPGLTVDNPGQSEFNASLLDLPPTSSKFTADPEKKSRFQRHLEAAMHGAADLARVTGHLKHDHRPDPYAQSYQLTPEAKNLTAEFEFTPRPMKRMDGFIDDNVRRTIARLAGIHTCSDPDHKKCRADTQQGITRGIHNSWHDLQQIKIPDCMTRLEKMQCEYDMGVLSVKTREAIAEEVQRLTSQGILMNLGTLTQETLRSKPAKRKLTMRGMDVVTEKRLRGYDEADNPRFAQMLVPRYNPGSFAAALANE